MSRKHFSFIEDSDIEKIVSDTLDIAKAAKERSKTDFERNVAYQKLAFQYFASVQKLTKVEGDNELFILQK